MEDFDTGQAEDVTLRLNVGATGAPEMQEGQIAQSDLLVPGSLFLGKYEIKGQIGSGGMGVVYHCSQILMGKDVAIKTLNKSSMNDEAVQRFQTEAKAAGGLSHPNLVSVYDFGVTDDGMPYMVMDFVPGKTLQEVLSAHGQMKLETVIEIFIQCAEGLAHAHEKGVLHRDIKPSNIILLEEENIGPGSIRILDFGIAKIASNSEQTQELTKTGVVIGSPLYMSPEQGTGRKMDKRTDVYSLGCVLFECLCGTPPFQGGSVIETMILHQSETPRRLKEASLGRDFPDRLQELVSAMMAKNVDERIRSMAVVHHELLNIQYQMKNPVEEKKTFLKAPQQPVADENKWMSTRVIIGAIVAFVVGISILMVILFPAQEVPIEKEVYKDILEREENSQAIYDGQVRKSIFQAKSRGLDIVSIPSVEFSQKQFELLGGEKWIRDLTLKKCGGITPEGLKAILKNRVESLSIFDSSLSDVCLAEISRCKTLRQLHLAACEDYTAAGLMKIASMKSLTDLNLLGAPVRDEFLEAFVKNKHEYFDLNIGKNSFINDNSMRILAKHQGWLNLDISYTSVSDEGLKHLGKNIIALIIIANQHVTDKGMETLVAQCPNLKAIQISGTRVTAEGLMRLTKLKNLKSVQIGVINMDAGTRDRIKNAFRSKKVETLGL